MSNQLQPYKPAVIDLRQMPPMHRSRTWQMQAAPSDYVPQPTPTATGAEKLSDLFDWLTGDGLVRIIVVAMVVLVLKLLFKLIE